MFEQGTCFFPRQTGRDALPSLPTFLPLPVPLLWIACQAQVWCFSPLRRHQLLLICLQIIVLAVLNNNHVKQVELIQSLPTQLTTTGSYSFSLFPARGENKAHVKAKCKSFPLRLPSPASKSWFPQQQKRSLNQSVSGKRLSFLESAFPCLTKFLKGRGERQRFCMWSGRQPGKECSLGLY